MSYLNNEVIISEACGLTHTNFNSFEHENEFLGNKEQREKASRYMTMLDQGRDNEIESELNIELIQ